VQSESETSAFPTALAVSRCLPQNLIKVTVGFADGRFGVYDMDTELLCLRLHSFHAAFADGAITAMATSNSYLLMVSEHKVLSLYEMFLAEPGHSTRSNAANTSKKSSGEDVKLLASLKADSILSPMSLSIRLAHSEIIASIVYSFFHIGCGWSLGIQELRFGKNGEQIGSRLATTVNAQYGAMPLHPLTRSRRGYSSSFRSELSSGESRVELTEPSILHQEPPTSISYSHPYLLTSHADNTLTVYLVVSTGAKIFVKGGQRLWGHTSSVSAVQVSDRGKAISVSSRGDEIRVWELESLIPSLGSSKAARGENSIQVNPENKPCKIHEGGPLLAGFLACQLCGPQLASGQMSREYARMGDCVGFDDERLLLSSRKETGTHLIEMYDFT
jgi:WD40 repeat protein